MASSRVDEREVREKALYDIAPRLFDVDAKADKDELDAIACWLFKANETGDPRRHYEDRLRALDKVILATHPDERGRASVGRILGQAEDRYQYVQGVA